MGLWPARLKIANEGGKLVIGDTICARVLAAAGMLVAAAGAVAGIGLAVRGWPSVWSLVLGLGLFAFAGLLVAGCGLNLFCPSVWIFDKEKGVLVCRPFLSMALLDLKRVTRVLVRIRGPFYRIMRYRPEDPGEKVPYWKYDLLLERSGATPLPMLEGENPGRVRAVAEAVCEYLSIPVVQSEPTPVSFPRPLPLFDANDPAVAGLPDHARELADQGHRIQAIQAYRESTGRGAAESVNAVDAYLKGKKQSSRIAPPGGGATMLLLLCNPKEVLAFEKC